MADIWGIKYLVYQQRSAAVDRIHMKALYRNTAKRLSSSRRISSRRTVHGLGCNAFEIRNVDQLRQRLVNVWQNTEQQWRIYVSLLPLSSYLFFPSSSRHKLVFSFHLHGLEER